MDSELLLKTWAENPAELTPLGAAADAFFEEGRYDEAFAARWMVLNDRWPGRRDVKRKPWVWVFRVGLFTNDGRNKSLRRRIPNAVLSPDLFLGRAAPYYLSFRTPLEALTYLSRSLESRRRLLGVARHAMPERPAGYPLNTPEVPDGP